MCTYKHAGCPEPSWSRSPDGLCIFHAPENVTRQEDARSVWTAALMRLAEERADFTGWHFPDDDNGFAGRTFESPAIFTRAVFSGEARFLSAAFEDVARFDNCIFAGNARFRHTVFKGDTLFSHTIFKAHAEFGGARFGNKCEFVSVDFRDLASFDGAAFDNAVDFRNAGFRGPAAFEAATFVNGGIFDQAVFRRDLDLRHSTVTLWLSFEKTRFFGPPAFDAIVLPRGKNSLMGLDEKLKELIP